MENTIMHSKSAEVSGSPKETIMQVMRNRTLNERARGISQKRMERRCKNNATINQRAHSNRPETKVHNQKGCNVDRRRTNERNGACVIELQKARRARSQDFGK
jgi:hypothetical protein